MNTKFYLDFRNKANDGKGSLIILIFQYGKSVSVSLGVRLSKNEWDGTKIVKRPDSSELNILITKKKNEIDKKLALIESDEDYEKLSLVEIKSRIVNKSKTKPEVKHLRKIDAIFKEYVEQNGLKNKTKDIYATTLGKISAYSGTEITIDDINYQWLLGFDRYMAQTLRANGRSIYMRALRAVCNYAVHIGITDKYAFKNFSIKSEPTMKRSVPVEILRKFYSTSISRSDRRYRDYFFLTFFLIGINSVDLLNARNDDVVGDRLEYIRSKTNKRYSIKIEPEAREIINRYRGETHLLNIMDTYKDYTNFVHRANTVLKKIGTCDDNIRVPLIPRCSIYYARHCWATIAYEIGIPMDTISQALGHSFGNRTTMIYIRFDQKKIDDANRKVIDYFMQSL